MRNDLCEVTRGWCLMFDLMPEAEMAMAMAMAMDLCICIALDLNDGSIGCLLRRMNWYILERLPFHHLAFAISVTSIVYFLPACFSVYMIS